mmetsp:Transcript_55517/g.118073  ORF Transcript_55517/g.118073 Transcript_55517/m.118073 type:complete len:294 (-) Transcript_55517:221-1102(-)|eukprot:CAMPEP_0172528534 /NCGR_PEP_ID=MMETSP1067-20121228/2906_1 /TAXON_ID=265564 ORGANISM="Thalassiosira punctigera, Strain Tpunct2005C2" /NCGR_SAMPLE_ID=MMETSP1067 /ASSEMBLY_ACC=CAM_ASM_000444 /LENGTH=293 /DNA_ID=CAMNT_0013312465 /DNA_START=16 /DNA_END=897 /DNA_ORIENTATION=-
MTTLLLIDVQKDFHPGGSLAIPAASDDASRTAAFIRTNSSSISRIVATMDSHHLLDIAHPRFWTDAEGNHPDPFTLISTEDVESGRWIPRMDLKHPVNSPLVDVEILKQEGDVPAGLLNEDGDLDIVKYCVEYTKRLESKGKFQHCIWPEHCIIGTDGHNVVPEVMEAMQGWCRDTGGSVEWVHKGQNVLTEMYSALAAEVPVSEETAFNQELFESLKEGTDKMVIVGQALSHCVNYTARDIVEHWPKEEMNKLTVFTDCCSPVVGFEGAGEEFLRDMKERGVNVETSETYQW